MPYDCENSEGWDCDPFAQIEMDENTLDETDDTGDWQEICLDRWGDRLVNGDY